MFYAALRSISRRRARPATTRGSPRSSGFALVFPYYHPDVGDRPDEIVPEKVMEGLRRVSIPRDRSSTTEVGQHQMWANQFIDREQPRTFLSSGGLGTMGFGFCRHRRRRSVPGEERGVRGGRWLVPDERAGDGDGR